jgi:solute carrier family 25 (mitochondrial carnitine/acylcarnitine transporter), member 20/29
MQTVLDHARFRVLLNKEHGKGSVSMAISIFKEHGLRRLYLGFYATWLRESSLGVYFGAYDTFITFARKQKYNDKLSSMVSGGLAGVATWASMYPIDYAKTLIQTDSLTNPQHKSATSVLIKEVKAKGLSVMYTGFPLMVARAFVVNGAGFLCFEKAKSLLY